mmetsp:Transcript_19163/g.32667  ORF Transcript_19163/g.32667 Transcript_19163/m.32667 type:complete len:87 (-) Transcript_19163:137-397(-)
MPSKNSANLNPTLKTLKLGKVIQNKFNSGIALIDMTKLDKLGANAVYNLSDYKALLWQPMWLDLKIDEENGVKPEENLEAMDEGDF